MGWTADDIPDLSGKIFIITGANSGLGYQTALQLVKKRAKVIMACRTASKAEDAIGQIKAVVPTADLVFIPLDLGDFESILDFANTFNEKFNSLDGLINNAGMGGIAYQKTKSGIEMHFGVNHIGHFLLTAKLFHILKATKASRIVNVSSEFNWIGKTDFQDHNYQKTKYNKWLAYGRSKLANALFTNELNQRIGSNGNPIAVTCHPGYSKTKLQAKGYEMEDAKFQARLINGLNTFIAQTDVMGALPTLYAATSPEVKAGDYIGPAFLRLRGNPVKQKVTSLAFDKTMGKQLWDKSESLTSITFDI